MTITDAQRASLLEAAKPLIAWLNANAHPHCTAIVNSTTCEVSEGFAVVKTEEFLTD